MTKNFSSSSAPSHLWPEEAWERRTPYLHLTPDALLELCDHFLGRTDLQSSALLTGGKCNTNLHLTFQDHEDLVLRIYEQDPRAARRDLLLNDILPPSVPAPRVLTSSVDHNLDDLLAAHTHHAPLAFFPFYPGAPPFEIMTSKDLATPFIHTLMHHLVTIHQSRTYSHHGLLDEHLEFRRPFDSTRSSFLDFVDWALSDKHISQRLGSDLSQAVQRHAHTHSPLLDQVTDHSLAHGDLKLSNLLVNTHNHSTSLSAILDWEYTFSGSLLFDLAIFLRHHHIYDYDLPQLVAQGLHRAGYTLPPQWLTITRTLDLMNLLGFLKGSQERTQLFQSVRHLIAQTTLP